MDLSFFDGTASDYRNLDRPMRLEMGTRDGGVWIAITSAEHPDAGLKCILDPEDAAELRTKLGDALTRLGKQLED